MDSGLFTAEIKLCFSLHQHIGLDKNLRGGGGRVISQCIFFSIWLNLSGKKVNHFNRNTSDHSIMQTIYSQD